MLWDGGECDLDLGNAERYLDVTLSKDNQITTGKIYKEVIEKERKGDYLGKTVQVIPHITNAIQDWIDRVARIPTDETGEEADVCIIEVGAEKGRMGSNLTPKSLPAWRNSWRHRINALYRSAAAVQVQSGSREVGLLSTDGKGSLC